jgi:2-methylisocitrate lyase-like PEP mutase family enzyme
VLIKHVVDSVPLPVNVMMMNGAPSPQELGTLGVARVSWGNIPYAETYATLQANAAKALS